MTWKFFVEKRDYSRRAELRIAREGAGATGIEFAVVNPMTLTLVRTEDRVPDEPTMRSEEGDIEAFLQGAMDAAWAMGLRPNGFADVAGEMKATRYHLEDMRRLAFDEEPVARIELRQHDLAHPMNQRNHEDGGR